MHGTATNIPRNQIAEGWTKCGSHLDHLARSDQAALVRLCQVKKVIRRADGYGSETETLFSNASAVMLKKRKLAVTGWSREMYPSARGHAFAQSDNA